MALSPAPTGSIRRSTFSDGTAAAIQPVRAGRRVPGGFRVNTPIYEELLAAVGEGVGRVAAIPALLLVDVADFAGLQAQMGFMQSAGLMERLAARFAAAVRDRGTVLRFADGGFCVLIGGLRNSGHAVLAAEKLVREAEQTMLEAELGIKPLLHVGIALHPQHAALPAELVRKAQLAAVAARKRGVRALLFDDSCAEQVTRPWELREAFAAALDSGGLSIFYQPKVRIADGRTVGAEALMRWLKDGRPVATPDVFIPLAEEAGLIHNTTWYALSVALREAADWPRANLGVAVNVTPGMLHHREFLDMVRSAIATWGVREGALTLEITEGAIVSDFVQATARLSALRDLGVRISIDDFGTGYSSLSYFKKIPAHELKIDKSFVMGMQQDPADQRLVETIVALANQFKLEIVAEGVEDEATLSALAAMGCDYAQGYLFAPALSQDRFRAWVEQHA